MEENTVQQKCIPSSDAAQTHQQTEPFGDLQLEGQEQNKTVDVEVKQESQECHMTSEKEPIHVHQQNTQQRLDEVGREKQDKQKEINDITPKKQKTLHGNKEVSCIPESEIPKEEERKCKRSEEQPPKKQNQNTDMQQQKQTKKQKDPVSENQERINYLVQVSKILATMPPSQQKKKCPESLKCADQALASQTGALAAAIGRRCVMRLSPALKRSLCKGCGVALVYGVNARVRHKSRRQKHLVVTCLACRTIKRFVNDPEHKLWCEQEEAIV